MKTHITIFSLALFTNLLPITTAIANPNTKKAIEQCLNKKTSYYRKEYGKDAVIRMDMIEEMEFDCKQDLQPSKQPTQASKSINEDPFISILQLTAKRDFYINKIGTLDRDLKCKIFVENTLFDRIRRIQKEIDKLENLQDLQQRGSKYRLPKGYNDTTASNLKQTDKLLETIARSNCPSWNLSR